MAKKRAKTTKGKTKKATGKRAATKKAAARKAAPKKATKKGKATQKVAKKTAIKKPMTRTLGPTLGSLTSIRIGEEVPTFRLPATGGQEVDLTQLRGKNVVLYFYPKDSTPGCTLEGQEFTQLHQEFRNTN